MPSTKLSTPTSIRAFLDRFDFFLFDCDGVLWRGDHLLPNIVETLTFLRSLNKQLLFVTNNSTKSRESYISKFLNLGIPVTIDEVFGSSYSAAIYISRILSLPADKKVFVIGEKGICDELEKENVRWCGGIEEDTQDMQADVQDDLEVGVVLVGLDRGINYRKLARAYRYLQREDVVFLATNIDSTFPAKGGLMPGAGSMSAPLTYMTGRTPVSLGKPSQEMMKAIEGRFQFDKSRACMVGDRINTDIRFGQEGGLGGTLGVLTGVCKEEEFLAEEGVVPEVYLDRLCDLLMAKE
ncbi:HAD-like domain-containing protein [Pyronema omphalodes]|nr:HAD-like domain-containing protein [Pyronema omphalodes]